jgi:hypothetical protein
VQFAQIGKQTRIVINGKVTDFIPNPTFERVAATAIPPTALPNSTARVWSGR